MDVWGLTPGERLGTGVRVLKGDGAEVTGLGHTGVMQQLSVGS